MMEIEKQWMAEISELDEYIGKKPRYPFALLESYIKKEVNNQNDVIRNSSTQIKDSILNSTRAICGNLENGYNLMVQTNNNGFNKIDNSLQSIESTLNWAFSKLIELNRQRNLLLGDIIALLNIPDIEKERKLNIERGLDFFKKTKIDDSFFADSKRFFEKALNIEETDYFVSYNLGLIYMFSRKDLNFIKAREFFLNAGKYSNADISFSSDNYTSHPSSFNNPINPKTIASYSYLYASRCEFKLGNKENALSLVTKSYNLTPNIVEIAYDTSKYLAVNNNLEKATSVLSKAIDLDRFITLKVLKDSDLYKHQDIHSLLKNKKDAALDKGTNLFKSCEMIISKNSSYRTELDKAHSFLLKKTFLDSMASIDILTK